jgi:hypothetical protein
MASDKAMRCKAVLQPNAKREEEMREDADMDFMSAAGCG